ncbi:hypothetical protein Tco_1577066 [Tanacetum coccineum]
MSQGHRFDPAWRPLLDKDQPSIPRPAIHPALEVHWFRPALDSSGERPQLPVWCHIESSTRGTYYTLTVEIVTTSRYVVPTGRVKVTTSRYVVPTGRVNVPAGRYVVPTGRYVVPTGKDNVVPTGRKVILAGSTILVLVVLCLLQVDSKVS